MVMALLREVRKETTNLAPAFALESGAVEPGVRPLVVALNDAPACSTIASCHGHRAHRFPFSRPAQRPYVLFRAPADFAQALTKWIGLGRGASRELKLVWAVTGYYYPSAFEELVWVIEAQDMRLVWGWDQGRIDADFLRLAAAVGEIRAASCSSE